MSLPHHHNTAVTTKFKTKTNKEFNSSNSTTAKFLGGKQKAWMTGEQGAQKRPSSKVDAKTTHSTASMPISATQLSEALPGIEIAALEYSAVRDGDLSKPFPPDYDRGRFPKERRRRGGTLNYAPRLSTSNASRSSPPAPSPPPSASVTPRLPAFRKNLSTATDNVLPSPSPSDEARHSSVHVIDLEEELQKPEQQGAHFTTRLEQLIAKYGGFDELEKKLEGSDRPNNEMNSAPATPDVSNDSPAPGTAAPNVGDDTPALATAGLNATGDVPALATATTEVRTSSESWPSNSLSPMHPGLPGRSQGSKDKSTPFRQSPVATSSKRVSEESVEPRKRVQVNPETPSIGINSQPSRPTEAPSETSQQRSSSTPALTGDMYKFSCEIVNRLQSISSVQGRRRDVEGPRLGLLRDACKRSDYFYLMLHQLFCLDHKFRYSGEYIPGLTNVHRSGLNILAFLLVSNDNMADDAVGWFSIFPLPLEALLGQKPAFKLAYDEVLKCLSKLANSWTAMRSTCSRRSHPPLVDELLLMFNVKSFILQQVICRAILRDIWIYHQDECFITAEDIFLRDHQEVMKRLSLAACPPSEVVAAYDQQIVDQYKCLWNYHQQHAQQTLHRPNQTSNTQTCMPPPQQSQNRLTTTNSNLTRADSNQPGLPPAPARSPSLNIDMQAAQRSLITTDSNPTRPQSSNTAPRNVAVDAAHPPRRQNHLTLSHQTSSTSSQPSAFYTQPPTALQGLQIQDISTTSAGQVHGQQSLRDQTIPGGAVNYFSPSSGNPWGPIDLSVLPSQASRILPSHITGSTHSYQSHQPFESHPHAYTPARSPSAYALSNAARYRSSSEIRRSQSSGSGGFHSAAAISGQFIRLPSIALSPAQPNSKSSALHQAHVRSPILSSIDLEGNPNDMTKYFSSVKTVIMPPQVISTEKQSVNWDFTIHRDLLTILARDVGGSYGAPPTRTLVPGSQICRIRCINVSNEKGLPTQSEWVIADNIWPATAAVVLNGTALEIRRKLQHGKDLPIDVTRYIEEGYNNLSTAVIGFSKDSKMKYAIGLEIVEVAEEKQIKDSIPTIPLAEARKRIIDASTIEDDEVQVIRSQLVLNLTDPFTSRIFEVPVRGTFCRHNQCFDLNVFLQTRGRKSPAEPCGPDEFRCPVCGKDARPQSLVKDGFLAMVRGELEKKDRLDAKAIILHEHGGWEVKEEEEATGESGDGTGKRSGQKTNEVAALGPGEKSLPRQSIPREVIEIDDD
ncbi:hypothetical protein MMC28_009709 [Mycoblastus sanguinarius]|nr:hypothetical protein [Mycoblastus sanguinarius]